MNDQEEQLAKCLMAARARDDEAAEAWSRVVDAESALPDASPGRLHRATMLVDQRLNAHRSSVVRPWVGELQWMCQTVLLCALRGCDTAPKHDPSKSVTRALRQVLLWNAKNDGSFMDVEPPTELPDMERYPQHWLAHTMHAAQIVGYCHPDAETRVKWNRLYVAFCQAWHVNPESKEEMLGRLKGENG